MKSTQKNNPAIPAELFSYFFPEAKQSLRDADIYNSRNVLVARTLCDFIDFNDTVTINGQKYHDGFTCRLSREKIAQESALSVRSVDRSIAEMKDAGVLEVKNAGICNKFRLTAFSTLHAKIKEKPPEQLDSVKHPPSTQSHDTANRSNTPANESEGSATVADSQDTSQEFKQDTSSTSSLAASTGIAPTMPTEGEREEAEPRDQPAHPASEPPPEPDPPPPACSRNGVEKPKTSQREKNADFAFRESFRLADKFAGDDIEFEDDNQRRQRASRFRNSLIKEVHSASAAARYPDPDLRLQACVEVFRLWIDIVKSRNNPAEYIGFISTEPGMRALTHARKQVFGSADQYREIELDPTVQALWRAKYGDNWREKREQEIAARAA